MQKVEWINKESGILDGIIRNFGDRFEVSNELAKQLIYQKLVKDVYVSKKDREEKSKKGDK